MSSLLRSSKFVRYFAGFARSLILSPTTGTDALFVAKSPCLTAGFIKSLCTQTVSSRPPQQLDRTLKRLDEDARRAGRISRRDLEDALEELRLTRSATSTQSLLIIRCCGNLVSEEPPQVRTQLVQEIWNTIEKLGVPMDISHYNALLRVYLENEHRFSPTEFLADLEKKGIEPNRVTYQRLIARYCQEGDIEGATRILEFMREKQLPVNESVFNALITGHFQADDVESAKGIIQVMHQAGLEPSSETYATLMCGHAKRGDMDAIRSIFQECDAKDVVLLDRDYMNVIYALTVNNHSEHVDEVIDRMKQMMGYNQEAVNLILRLVNAGYDNIAMKILLTLPPITRLNGETSPTGIFFIRHLVKANRPLEKIVSLCQKLEQDGLNPQALSIATETSIALGNVELSRDLLALMKQQGYAIRPHYFWPLLVACGKKGDREGLLNVVRMMTAEFGIPVGGETLRDYVVPYLKDSGEMSVSSADEVTSLLMSAGVSPASTVVAVVFNLLTVNKLSEAAEVASRHRAHYSFPFFRRPLIQAYQNTRNTEAYLNMVLNICEGTIHQANVNVDEDGRTPVVDAAEIVGQLLLDLMKAIREPQVLQEVLEGLLSKGLSISNSTAEHVQEKLGGELTTEMSTLLSKLTSGELVPVAATRTTAPQSQVLGENHLESLITAMRAKGDPAWGYRKQLLTLYCRNKNLEKAEPLIKGLEADGFVFSSGVTAQIVELYLMQEKLEEALKYWDQMKAIDPDFVLDDIKVIRLATSLVKNDRVQDAVKLLKEHPRDFKLGDRSFGYNSLCWRLLNALAEQSRVEEVKEVFNILLERDFADVNTVLMGPLIKVHLLKDDMTSALAQFEEAVLKYRLTPLKNEIARKLIEAEDATNLQYLTDLSTKVHGEINSLYDLVFAFVECGRIRQARKILETPGLHSRPLRLNTVCERYRQEGMVTSLEGLLEATRDLSHIDRSDLFYNLLLSYCNAHDPDKALGLWTRMQEEDVRPTDLFLKTLGNFLQSVGRDVPFVIPAPPEESTFPSEENYQTLPEEKRRMDFGGKNLHMRSVMSRIGVLVKDNRLQEASKLFLDNISHVDKLGNVSRLLVGRLGSAGDVETLASIGIHLDLVAKRRVLFENNFCHAKVVSGQSSEYLDTLEKRMDSMTTEDLAENFPRGGILGMLQVHPELCSRFEVIARNYAKLGVLDPINMLWQYLMTTGNYDPAEKLWQEFLVNSPRFQFGHITKVARDTNDVDLAQKLIGKLKDSHLPKKALALGYSCLLNVFVNTDQIEEGLKTMEQVVKDVSLEDVNRGPLLRLKSAAARKGKIFPYTIPAQNAKQESSSSSDDDESEVAAREV